MGGSQDSSDGRSGSGSSVPRTPRRGCGSLASARLSHLFRGAQWAMWATADASRGSEIRWLRHGVRRGVSGALVRIGVSGRAAVIDARIRESDVAVPLSVLRVHNKLAAAIAREIMVTDRQGYGGTIAP